LQGSHNWNIKDIKNWNTDQLFTVWDAAIRMEIGLNTITGGQGKNWMDKNLNSITFMIGGVVAGNSYVEGSTVHLLVNFENENLIWSSPNNEVETMIAHELGHVFDNRTRHAQWDVTWFGGGAADELMKMVGGKSTGLLKFLNNSLSLKTNRFLDVDGFGYGNNSSADYFAHAFSATICTPNTPNTPLLAEMWMSALLDLTK